MNASVQRRFLSLLAAMLAALFLVPFAGIVGNAQALAAIDEEEPNDDYEEATHIQMNEAVYGMLENGSGPDYYFLNVPVAGSVKLTVTNGKRQGTGWNRFLVKLYNRHFEEIDSLEQIDAQYTRPETKDISLPKGTCYLLVKYDSWWSGVSDNHPYHFKLTYNIPDTSITKVTPAKKKFTVKWTKKSGAYKYQIRYSVNKNMAGAKTVNVAKSAKAKVVKGLKAKKKYYVQVRVAKKIGGQVYWSKWSAKKSVKTK